MFLMGEWEKICKNTVESKKEQVNKVNGITLDNSDLNINNLSKSTTFVSQSPSINLSYNNNSQNFYVRRKKQENKNNNSVNKKKKTKIVKEKKNQ